MVLIEIIILIILPLCIECPSQRFGLDCKERCSGHCINNEPCDHVRGVCPSGCQDGYFGTLCTDRREYSFFCNIKSTY